MHEFGKYQKTEMKGKFKNKGTVRKRRRKLGKSKQTKNDGKKNMNE